MASDEASGAPADWLIKFLKQEYEKFKKTKYTAPVAIGITAVIYYLMLAYMMGSCWLGLLPPLILFGLFWNFDVKRVRKLLVYGFIGCTLLLAISTAFLVSAFQSLEPQTAFSSDPDNTLYDGIVTPMNGDSSTLFTYSVTVRPANETFNITEVRVTIAWIGDSTNESMTLADSNETSGEYFYEYRTTLSEPYNAFEFAANVSGTWIVATDYTDDGDEMIAIGPISSDSVDLGIWVLRHITLIQSYLQFFPIYAIICGMVWWTRRARRMREKAIQEWEQKRKKIEAKPPEDDSRSPSLARAIGLEEEPDSFVCSECGADVPSDAKSCPSCGEKFN
ncbi:MAG: zinc ribbon domain-containing protein [Methanobacteriota archaeon]|nr:MAG: zinc ribbon domain-containing protein [Euryarchaeota archaeon]